jgi:hypothetical protein
MIKEQDACGEFCDSDLFRAFFSFYVGEDFFLNFEVEVVNDFSPTDAYFSFIVSA